MGASAQVREIPLLVEADNSILGQVVNELYFIGLFLFFHKFDGLSAGQFEAFQLQLFLADFAHFCFQGSQIIGSEGSRSIKIIIEAVVNAGADGQLYIGVQSFHSLRQHMGAGVPIGFAVFLVFKGKLIFFRHFLFLLYIYLNRVWASFTSSGQKNKPQSHTKGTELSAVPPSLTHVVTYAHSVSLTPIIRTGILTYCISLIWLCFPQSV